ncbi:MAG: GNAT family N-acetyltransferase [Gemmatimonadetes bacterium]|nr:GNAT family N-acetyltransferase [Gemmatimonadota bacterium]
MIALRQLETLDEFRECVSLQKTTWGDAFADVVPGSLLQVIRKTGGLVGGAFDDDRMIGFVLSLLGTYEATTMHWSHMLAVSPDHRGQGLGRRLKLFQRDELLESGIDTVFWTFDPMVAANAHLNLNRLGASVVRYVPNMYGADTGSPLHAGGDTDRLIVRWDLNSQRASWAIEGAQTRPPSRRLDDSGVVTRASATDEDDLPGGDEVLIEVPTDLTKPTVSASELVAWRRTVRDAFMTYLRRGYAVQSLHRATNADRAYYFLRRV